MPVNLLSEAIMIVSPQYKTLNNAQTSKIWVDRDEILLLGEDLDNQ